MIKICIFNASSLHVFLISNAFVGSTGEYILENLIPKTTYDFRFGSKNLVGFSLWGAARQLTMPDRGPPEPPRIDTNVRMRIILMCTVQGYLTKKLKLY